MYGLGESVTSMLEVRDEASAAAKFSWGLRYDRLVFSTMGSNGSHDYYPLGVCVWPAAN